MKLQAIMTFSMALALPAALQAQTDDMEILYTMTNHGVSLKVEGGYRRGNLAILVSLDGSQTTELPGSVGGGTLDLGGEISVLIAGQADSRGGYFIYVPVNTQALADQGVKVYLQAVSLNDSDFGEEGESEESGLRISSRLDLDFAEEMQWATQEAPGGSEDEDEPESGDRRRRGDQGGTEGEEVKH